MSNMEGETLRQMKCPLCGGTLVQGRAMLDWDCSKCEYFIAKEDRKEVLDITRDAVDYQSVGHGTESGDNR